MIGIYIAGPLFNAHERNYLELIASELEGSGYKCFLPHWDQSLYRLMEDASCAYPPAWAFLRSVSASQSNTDLPWRRK